MKNTVKLKPYCRKIGSGVTPRGGDSVYIESGVALIRSQNVYNGSFSTEGLAFVDNDIAQRMKGVTIENDDILLNITGDSVARCCKVPKSLLPARVNQHVSIIRTNRDTLNPQFLMYFLISPQMQSTMLSLAGSGGTRKALTKEMIENFDIPLVDYTKQEKIAGILSAYDDLIDTNRRRIKLLEEAARLLFREWFVYFKFPNHEKIKIVDCMPEGWGEGLLEDIAIVKKGKNITFEHAVEGDIPVVGGGLEPTYYHNKANVSAPVITISASGANAGYVNMYDTDIWASDCSYINKNSTKYIYSLYLRLKSLQTAILGFQVGVAQPHVYPRDLNRLKLLIPPDDLCFQFEQLVTPIFILIKHLKLQNQKLAQARDLLLPRLMNGTIQV
jgi:type I restriction enzyme S subunit